MFNRKFFLVILCLSQINSIWSAAKINGSFIQSRIHDGGDADIKDAYFMVSIRKNELSLDFWNNPKTVFCGASLISEDVVLTAAHCVMKKVAGIFKDIKLNDFVVVMGHLNRKKKDKYTLKFAARQVARGPFSQSYEHDIALIFLKGKVPTDHPNIRPVILSSGPVVEKRSCYMYGWGLIDEFTYPDNLQVGKLLTVSTYDCQYYINSDRQIKRGTFCAGYIKRNGPSLLSGDSGGPLIYDDGTQIGIASWVPYRGRYKDISVFTDISKYKAWILKKVHEHKGTAPTFADVSEPSTL